eukprot:TRINITY_DN3298_c0_g1_i2.p1 TRINITY_DN3298_c0_g1~~TRINITY_DN3298_c0_g1_i2.p1  ORF type:complete len:329 (+),score=41.22 TRINITY_DN3298_c0_g1_i2:256-1242(+)
MAYPASGLEVAFRNDLTEVLRFLRHYHGENYRIFNVSERDYNIVSFKGKYEFLGWNDHHAPPLPQLIKVIKAIDAFLSLDSKNVAAIHCNAGRGRTGTVIASYFLYKNSFDDPTQAIKFFNDKRGARPSLTLPSQIQCVHRFSKLVSDVRSNKIYSPKLEFPDNVIPKKLFLSKMIITPIPHVINIKGCTPLIEIFNEPAFFPSKSQSILPFFRYTSDRSLSLTEQVIVVKINQFIQGDILFRLSHVQSLPGIGPKVIPMFKFHIHTSFIPIEKEPFFDLNAEDLDNPEFEISIVSATSRTTETRHVRVRLLFRTTEFDDPDVITFSQ